MNKPACVLLLTGASVRLAAQTGHNLFAYISVEASTIIRSRSTHAGKQQACLP